MSKLEKQSLEAGLKETLLPRKEYASGQILLNFESFLSGGNFLQAREENGGEITIVIKDRAGNIIHDFKDDLPGGFHFAGPREVRLLAEKTMDLELLHGGGIGQWLIDGKDKIIQIGDWRQPEDILSLTHEIGHSQIPGSRIEKIALWRELSEYLKDHPDSSLASWPDILQLNCRKRISLFFQEERQAWAYALNLIRKLKREGINLLDHASSVEIRHRINYYLKTHWEHLEPTVFELILKDREFAKEMNRLCAKLKY